MWLTFVSMGRDYVSELVTLDGLVVVCLPPDQRFAGSNTDKFLGARKIRSTTSFGGGGENSSNLVSRCV
jgi:hypothetical protein